MNIAGTFWRPLPTTWAPYSNRLTSYPHPEVSSRSVACERHTSSFWCPDRGGDSADAGRAAGTDRAGRTAGGGRAGRLISVLSCVGRGGDIQSWLEANGRPISLRFLGICWYFRVCCFSNMLLYQQYIGRVTGQKVKWQKVKRQEFRCKKYKNDKSQMEKVKLAESQKW